MTVRGTCSVLALAFGVIATVVSGTSRARAADDVIPPTRVNTPAAPRTRGSRSTPGRPATSAPLAVRRRRPGEWRLYIRASLPSVLRLLRDSRPMPRHRPGAS